MIKKLKLKLLTKSFIISIAAFFVVVAVASAVTTISANISTGGTLTVSGGTVSSSALATIGTAVTATGVDVSANVGRVAGLQVNLASSGSTVDGFRGIDSRVIDSGTAANAVGVQGFATHLANVSTGELWGGNMIAKLTAGGVENLYGGVNEARVVAGAVGSGTHNYVTGGLNIYDVSGTATFGTETVKAASIGVLIGNNSNSTSKTKATGAFVAIIGGDTVLTTGGAAFKVLNHSVSFPSKFDYGLDLWSDETPGAVNSFATADIRLQNAETISNSTDGTIAFGSANLTNTGNITVTSGYVNSPSYQVGQGAAISATVTPSKASFQQASYWPVITSGGAVDIDLIAMDQVDVGRHLLFSLTAVGGALTVTSGVGMTVVQGEIIDANGAADAVGDAIDCLITTTATAYCTTYASN